MGAVGFRVGARCCRPRACSRQTFDKRWDLVWCDVSGGCFRQLFIRFLKTRYGNIQYHMIDAWFSRLTRAHLILQMSAMDFLWQHFSWVPMRKSIVNLGWMNKLAPVIHKLPRGTCTISNGNQGNSETIWKHEPTAPESPLQKHIGHLLGHHLGWNCVSLLYFPPQRSSLANQPGHQTNRHDTCATWNICQCRISLIWFKHLLSFDGKPKGKRVKL